MPCWSELIFIPRILIQLYQRKYLKSENKISRFYVFCHCRLFLVNIIKKDNLINTNLQSLIESLMQNALAQNNVNIIKMLLCFGSCE